MLAVFLRELKSQYTTMTGWLFSAFVLVFAGIYTMLYNLNYGYSNFEYVLSGMTLVYLVAIPILTMRSFAEERHQKTDQLLYSLPLSSAKIMLGKYAALLVVLAAPLVVLCAYPLILSFYGNVYLPTAYASILAFFLMGAALTAIGMFASALCESQVTAAVAAFGIILLDYFLTTLASYIPSGSASACAFLVPAIALAAVGLAVLTKNGPFSVAVGVVAEAVLVAVMLINPSVLDGFVADFFSGISLFDRFSPFVSGIFDLTSIAFYLAVILVFAFITTQTFEKRRWS